MVLCNSELLKILTDTPGRFSIWTFLNFQLNNQSDNNNEPLTWYCRNWADGNLIDGFHYSVFGRTSNAELLVNLNKIFSISSGRGADAILFPSLRQYLIVSGYFYSPPIIIEIVSLDENIFNSKDSRN